jgi:SAM-dependent methyltransferase
MMYRRMPGALRLCPDFVQRYVLDFEARIEDAVRNLAAELPTGALVLDAGAGEAQYSPFFTRHRYTAVDLGVGDAAWSYQSLDAVAALEHLPFRDGTFDAALNIVTLEHVREPARVLREIARVLKPGGRLLLVTPLDWEEHQQPHDYYRYTRYGLAYLLESAGLTVESLAPAGGLFRLLSRRLFAAGQAVPLLIPVFAPLALLSPLLDRFDKSRHFTLGHTCRALAPVHSNPERETPIAAEVPRRGAV